MRCTHTAVGSNRPMVPNTVPIASLTLRPSAGPKLRSRKAPVMPSRVHFLNSDDQPSSTVGTFWNPNRAMATSGMMKKTAAAMRTTVGNKRLPRREFTAAIARPSSATASRRSSRRR